MTRRSAIPVYAVALVMSGAWLDREASAQAFGVSTFCFESGNSTTTRFKWCLDEAGLLTKYETGQVNIEYELKNISGAPTPAFYLYQFVELDPNHPHINARPATSSRSAWSVASGSEPLSLNRFSVTATSFNVFVPSGGSHTFDWLGRGPTGRVVYRIGEIGAGRTKKVKFQYRRD